MPEASDTQIIDVPNDSETAAPQSAPESDPALRAELEKLKRQLAERVSAAPAAAPDDPAPDASEDTEAGEEASDIPVWKHEDDWAYDSLEFHGDVLGIRIPNVAAIQGWQLSQSSTNSDAFQLNGSNRLLLRHMSPESYARFIYRLGEPDDPDYDEDTYAEMIDALVTPARERAEADAAERAKVSK